MSIKIGERTLEAIGKMVEGVLKDHRTEIDEAYMKAGDDSLTISVSVKITPAKEGNQLETGISFVSERVKDKAIRIFSEDQKNFLDDPSGDPGGGGPGVKNPQKKNDKNGGGKAGAKK